jgi:integrase
MRAATADVIKQGGIGSVRQAVERYFASDAFVGYSKSTRDLRRPILNRLVEANGSKPLADWDETFTAEWLALAKNQGVRRTLLLALQPFARWAVEEKLIKIDPTAGIKIKSVGTEGHWTWTDDEIAQYRAHHPLGSMARVAIELALNVAARRGDMVALGRAHLKAGRLTWVQEKNRDRKPSLVSVRMNAQLAAAIKACPLVSATGTFLINERGQPFSKSAFGDWFARQVAAAGLAARCVVHGLRKAACRIMAENGCTEREIAAVSGHRSLNEVRRYTEAVNNVHLADRASDKLEGK